MTWSANIALNTGTYLTVENLISIDRKSTLDSSITKYEDFKNFQLPQGQLSFVGEKEVVAINSREIKYVQLMQD